MEEGKLENRLWEIFNLGMEAGYHSGMRLVVDNARDNAAKIIKELNTMRSPEEVRGELKNAKTMMWPSKRHNKYQRGYINALKWVLCDAGMEIKP